MKHHYLPFVIVFLVQLIVFKLYYPYANFNGDSYSYLAAAASNVDVNTWPVAYSKVLRLISVFTQSDTVVVGLQYFFLQGSSLVFLFFLFHFTKPGRATRRILSLFLLLNPIPLYIANYISSDAFFISLSLLWLTSLVWIIYQPRYRLIIIHGLLLLACFVMRYNAIYYPVVSLLAFLLSRQTRRYKIVGIGFGAGLVLVSILYTSQEMQTVTGKRQFSAFGGWQLANNALYMYENIPANKREPVPARFSTLETMVRRHMDTLCKVKLTPFDSVSTNFYLWNDRGPLMRYLNREHNKLATTSDFIKWASEGPLYGDYGFYLIRKYPWPFVKYFILPNAGKFAVPPIEFLGMYNMGLDSVPAVAKDWFNYKSLRIREHNSITPVYPTEWYPVFNALVNVLFLMGLIGIIALHGIRWKEYGLTQLLIVASVLWILNCGFSIFASPVVLRYQIFSILVFFSLSVLLVERIWKLA